jgi:hypothetical protein
MARRRIGVAFTTRFPTFLMIEGSFMLRSGFRS